MEWWLDFIYRELIGLWDVGVTYQNERERWGFEGKELKSKRDGWRYFRDWPRYYILMKFPRRLLWRHICFETHWLMHCALEIFIWLFMKDIYKYKSAFSIIMSNIILLVNNLLLISVCFKLLCLSIILRNFICGISDLYTILQYEGSIIPVSGTACPFWTCSSFPFRQLWNKTGENVRGNVQRWGAPRDRWLVGCVPTRSAILCNTYPFSFIWRGYCPGILSAAQTSSSALIRFF